MGALAWSDARKPVDCAVPKGVGLRVERVRLHKATHFAATMCGAEVS